MRTRLLLVLCVIFIIPVMAHAASTVSVPDGTRVGPIKMGDDETVATLKPGEQVALLFIYGMWSMEQDCLHKDWGIGRLATLGELIKGVKAASGETIGLSVNPVKDSNYSYDIVIIGQDILIRAVSRVKDLGSLAIIGPANRMSGNLYYNPDGPDLVKAVKVTEYGYEGNGFRR